MSRPHSLVQYLQLKSLLERVTGEMEALESSDVNFRLDREFSTKLGELVKRYGYTDREVVELVQLVHAHESHGSEGMRVLMRHFSTNVDSTAGSGAGR